MGDGDALMHQDNPTLTFTRKRQFTRTSLCLVHCVTNREDCLLVLMGGG